MRGHNARKDLRNEILNKASNERQAATNIQKVVRGHQGRNKFLLEEQRQQTGQAELFGGLRSGKTRMQKHRDENPELNQLRQQLSDNKRGQLQLSDNQKAAKIARIQEIVAQNKVMKEQGQGPKLGRPAGGQAAKTRSDKGIPRGSPKKK